MYEQRKPRFPGGWSDLLITEAIETPTFANHESFHLRYGWLKKAYDAVMENPRIFVFDDAPIRLGVGKNMVRAIRFWALSSKMIEPRGDRKGTKNPEVEPTRLGHAIFRDGDGLDPYLEDPQTLWLLHWLLFAPPCRIPIWWIILNEFTATNIKTDDLAESIQHRVTNISEWNTPSANSVKKDIDVFIHTYTTKQGKLATEDYLDCPFRQMHMIRQQEGSQDTMRFVFGRKYGMTPKITAFACLDFIDRLGITSKSVSVTRLATEAGCVGNAFKIGENDLADLLNDACLTTDQIRMENVNGAQHLVFDDARIAAERVLGEAYNKDRFRLSKIQTMEALITD